MEIMHQHRQSNARRRCRVHYETTPTRGSSNVITNGRTFRHLRQIPSMPLPLTDRHVAIILIIMKTDLISEFRLDFERARKG